MTFAPPPPPALPAPGAPRPAVRILFGKYSGSNVLINGTEYLMLREDEILAVSE